MITVELLILGIAIVVGLFIFVSYYLGKRSKKDQQERDLIEKYYPDLIEDLRLSSPNSTQKFIEGREERYESFFSVLVEWDINGTLKIFESIDEVLYSDLKKVLNDLLPSLEKIERKRKQIWNIINEKWFIYFEKTKGSLPPIDPYTVIPKIKNTIIWELWQGNIQKARKKFNDILYHSLFFKDENTASRVNTMFEAFQRIAEEEWKSLKSEFKSVSERLKELIEINILPKMENTLLEHGK